MINSDYKIHYIDNPNQFLQDNMHQKEGAFDTETNSLNPFSDGFKVGCITMCFDGVNGYYLSFDKINIRLLNRFFQNKYTIGANIKYDCKALQVFGVTTINPSEDIILLYHVLNTMRKHNNLKSLAWLLPGDFGGYDQVLDDYKKKYNINSYLEIPENILVQYATLDAIVTFKLWQYAQEYLIPKQPNVYKVYKEILMPMFPVYTDMEMGGISIDFDYLNKINIKYENELKIVEDKILKLIGKNIDVNSNEQLAKELERLELPDKGRIKKGLYQTGDNILKQWKQEGYEIADLILEYRRISKIISSFIGEKEEKQESEFNFFEKETKKESGIVKNIGKDGKVHPSYGIAMTEALRQNCSDINIQQFPRDTELRKIFKLEKDYQFAEFDISGFHLRLMAYYSQDPEMVNIFVNNIGNRDLHSKTAQTVFMRNISLDKIIEKKNEEPYFTYRYNGKKINFLFIYNGSPMLLTPTIELEWELEEIDKYINKNNLEIEFNKSFTIAKDIHTKFMNTYKNIPIYSKQQIEKAKKTGYIDNMFGGRRHLPELKYIPYEQDKKQKDYIKHLYNIATNTEVLSSEALMMDITMKKIHKEFKKNYLKSKLLIMVHDSICIKMHKDEQEQVINICMKNLSDFELRGIPIDVEYFIGDVWGH